MRERIPHNSEEITEIYPHFKIFSWNQFIVLLFSKRLLCFDKILAKKSWGNTFEITTLCSRNFHIVKKWKVFWQRCHSSSLKLISRNIFQAGVNLCYFFTIYLLTCQAKPSITQITFFTRSWLNNTDYLGNFLNVKLLISWISFCFRLTHSSAFCRYLLSFPCIVTRLGRILLNKLKIWHFLEVVVDKVLWTRNTDARDITIASLLG